ncbi:MAG: gamma carbonic anhydrase family protein [Candidatus Methanofastidiosia archaeon]|jgi:carbonic anhydrase/acetyltransferase-like protein (isoleucine patch superfamily)
MIYPFEGKTPQIDQTAFIAKNATIVGDVTIGAHASVWPNAVLRGDFSSITIGNYTSIQDTCVIHVDGSLSDSDPESPAILGDYCTIGHGALLHGCTLENRVLVGASAVVFNRTTIGEGSIIAMGCVIPDNKKIPPRSVVMGVPGKVVREITAEEWEQSKAHAELYAALADKYRSIL